jgi:hypothetical protein
MKMKRRVGIIAVLLLTFATLASVLFSPLDQYHLFSYCLLVLIWVAGALSIYAGLAGSRLWWLILPLCFPCSFLWLLAQGH